MGIQMAAESQTYMNYILISDLLPTAYGLWIKCFRVHDLTFILCTEIYFYYEGKMLALMKYTYHYTVLSATYIIFLQSTAVFRK